MTGDMDGPVNVETFTIPQAAEALGRAVATFRRWLEADKIPSPYLRETSHDYAVYSVGELEVLAGVIGQHERDFVYLVSEHNHVVQAIHQAIHGYRTQYI